MKPWKALVWPACALATGYVSMAASPLGAADAPHRLLVPTLAGVTIALDGKLDEPAWQQAAEIPELTQHEPEPGASSEFRTRILLFTDGESLLLGYDCYDPEPERIATHALQRDGSVEGDDSVDFVLDTFGDRSTAYWFLVTAGGARADGLVSATNGGFPSLDWDGAWNAVARRTTTGWSAEVVVPARTLHFRRGTDGWGFNIARQVARQQLVLRWTGIPHDANFFDLQNAGLLDGLGGMRQGLGLAVAPFAVGQRSRERPASSVTSGHAGADVSYSF
ncbi:MAG TPA: carbohydrate binding family 9 domain-containing protein, partial [Thermoanaerobaculia bacterium]|nr:carbohydrate binding family 9 domain-containing protein [Thermoanaerobaculia bacterium]